MSNYTNVNEEVDRIINLEADKKKQATSVGGDNNRQVIDSVLSASFKYNQSVQINETAYLARPSRTWYLPVALLGLLTIGFALTLPIIALVSLFICNFLLIFNKTAMSLFLRQKDNNTAKVKNVSFTKSPKARPLLNVLFIAPTAASKNDRFKAYKSEFFVDLLLFVFSVIIATSSIMLISVKRNVFTIAKLLEVDFNFHSLKSFVPSHISHIFQTPDFELYAFLISILSIVFIPLFLYLILKDVLIKSKFSSNNSKISTSTLIEMLNHVYDERKPLQNVELNFLFLDTDYTTNKAIKLYTKYNEKVYKGIQTIVIELQNLNSKAIRVYSDIDKKPFKAFRKNIKRNKIRLSNRPINQNSTLVSSHIKSYGKIAITTAKNNKKLTNEEMKQIVTTNSNLLYNYLIDLDHLIAKSGNEKRKSKKQKRNKRKGTK